MKEVKKTLKVTLLVDVSYDAEEVTMPQVVYGVEDALDYYHDMLINEGYCDLNASIEYIETRMEDAAGDDKGMCVSLSDSTRVQLVETWDCCDSIHDCGASVEVIDCESGDVLGTIPGMSLPDTDDEDYDPAEFVSEIESRLDI